eukprot:5712941-Amphidinium_carterae.3
MNGKSAADGLPTKVLRVLLDHLVPVWTRAFNCFLDRGDVPDAYKGTQLFLVHKKEHAGTDYPLVEVTQLQEWTRVNKHRVALWFVDVRTAFDKILRQILSSPGSSVTLESLTQIGIECELAKKILIEVQANKPVLWDTGISEAHQRLLNSMLQHTWLVMPSGQGDSQLETHLGTPQGSSLSGLIYLLYQQSILTTVTQFLHENGLALELRTPADNTLRVDAAPLQPVPVIAYHDDVVIPIKSDSAANLVVSARAVIEFAVPRFHGHNLMINWGKHKSEIMFLLPSEEARAFHATLEVEAKARQWESSAIRAFNLLVRVVRACMYLGRKILDTGSVVQHVRERAAIAASTSQQFNKVFSSAEIQIQTKADLCNAVYILPQLTSALATLPAFEAKVCKAFGAAYMKGWKSCLNRERINGGEFLHYSDDYILDRLGKHSWQVHLDILRLRLVARVLKATCPLLRAFLACVVISKNSWWNAVASSALRLKTAVGEAQELPDLTEATFQVLDLQPLSEEIFTCFICDRTFGTYRGMLSHRRQKHGTDSALSSRVQGNCCVACSGEFSSRKALLEHYGVNLRCSLYIMTQCPQLTEEELVIARQIKSVARMAPPTRGRKMPVQGFQLPQSCVVQLLDIDIEGSAE